MEKLSEARHDEQRVVDANADPDHRNQDRRDRVDVGQPGQDEQEQECRPYRHQCQRDRDDRRHEGAEDEEEHDDRHEQTERLGGPLLERRKLGVAVELHRHAGRLDRLTHGVLNGDHRVAVLVLDRLIELRLRVGDAAVVGDGRLAERIVDADEAGPALGRCELRRLEARDRLLDRRPALRCVESLAFRRGEHDVQNPTLLGRELGLDQVGCLLGVRPGYLELIAKRTTDGRDQENQQRDDTDPPEHDPPGMRRARSRPAREPAGSQTFVGLTALYHDFLSVRPLRFVITLPFVESFEERRAGPPELIGPPPVDCGSRACTNVPCRREPTLPQRPGCRHRTVMRRGSTRASTSTPQTRGRDTWEHETSRQGVLQGCEAF